MTRTAAETFSLIHAKHLASKVTSDMWRCNQLYGRPSEQEINDYGTELALRLRDEYVAAYEFGFQLNDERILSWKYTVDSSGQLQTDERPGKIISGVDVSMATMFNFMTYSAAWGRLSADEQEKYVQALPFKRTTGSGPRDGNGYWTTTDRNYSSGGNSLSRATFRPYNI